MERHFEKRRDMARSILPSKNRKPARDALARAKRANRRVIRQDLALLGGTHRVATSIGIDPPWGDRWDERCDLRRYPSVEIRDNVRWRRDGDKVEHFIRWAIAITAELPIDDRLSHLRGVLGVGVIGDHAMSHLADEPELRRTQEHDWRHGSVRTAERKAQLAAGFELLRVLLHEVVITPGGLKVFNNRMKTCDRHATHGGCREAGCVKRCLAGRHDIEGFLRDVDGLETRWGRVRLPASLPARRFRSYLQELRDFIDFSPVHRPAGF